MFHYTYLLQHKESDMMYIGVRSCECMPQQDNYWGSSKHLPENASEICDKFILGVFDSREEAALDEIARHDKNDVARNPLFWNQAKATSTGFDRLGTTYKQKPEAVEKMKATSKRIWPDGPPGMRGMKHTEETKRKMSKVRKGKKFTEEHKANMSKWQKGVSKPKIKCPHCEKEGYISLMKRWHFDNCKALGEKS